MPSLRIEVGGQTFVAVLPEGPVRVGRDPECELRINDPDVSGTHLTIEPLFSGFHKLTDANSGRATRVNGVVVKRVSLQPGDVVEVGPARLTYVVDEDAPMPVPVPVAMPPAQVWSAAPPPPPAPVPAARPAPMPVPTAVAAPSLPTRLAPATPVPVAPPPIPVPALTGAAPVTPLTTETPAARAARVRTRKRLTGALLGLGVVAAVAFLAASFIGSSGDAESARAALAHQMDKATDLQRAGDFAGAAALYERIARAPNAGETGAKASRYLAQLQSQLDEADHEYDQLWADRMALDPSEAQTRFDELKSRLGEGTASRHSDLVTKMAAEQRKWLDVHKPATAALAATRAKDGRFAEAIAVWDQFRSEGPVVDEARRAAEDGRAAIDALANDALGDVVRDGSALAEREGPEAAARLLRTRGTAFAGTFAAAAIEAGATAYEYEAARLVAIAPPAPTGPTSPRVPTGPTLPGPTRPGPKTPPGPGPGPTTAPPALRPTERARIDALVAGAEARAAGRQFAAAALAFEEALAAMPKGSPDAARVAGRRDDAALARDGLDLLGKTIREHPERFTAVPMTDKFTIDLTDADAEFLIGTSRGGATKYRWGSVETPRLLVVMDRARLPAKESLPLAGILRAIGANEAAEKLLFRFVEDGGDAPLAHAAFARWRGESVPPGGYVIYEGRLVSPADRDRVVLDARIAQAIPRISDKNAATRKAAIQDLLSLGVPAREPLTKALEVRRAAVVQEVAALKVFTSSRTKGKLQQELERRRTAALALIENPGLYPYPSATHQGQEEVDHLVDLVREVWERPFDLIASWDKGATEALAALSEVDGALAKVVEGYAPDLEAVKAAVGKAVDMPNHVPDEYSKKVLAFNLKVATTATREERDNMLAVNEYRMMMGRPAVKIDERLVRAARGHSIEMRLLNYFAHESPTPGLESPGKRCAREGYNGGTGENIAMGMPSGRDAFNGWFHSSGHHRNMISKSWTEMGAGRSGAMYFTQNFGGMTGNNLKEPDPLPPLRADIAAEPDEGEPPPPMKGKGKGRVPDKPPPGPPPDKPPDKPSDKPPDDPPGMTSGG